MNSTNAIALLSGITLAVTLLSSGLSVSDWQFWVAGFSIALAFVAGQKHGRATQDDV